MESKYISLCNTKSDINEHLPTLYEYTKKCESVFETGVRGVISSWAFGWGLINNDSLNRRMFMNDIEQCNIEEFSKSCDENKISLKYEWKNNLELDFEENESYDLTFIDTWHIYGQLKRELEKFSKITNKYIIMHDTTIDAIQGEALRCQWTGNWETIRNLSKQSGIPTNEIIVGLWPAVEQFLESHPEWVIEKQYYNNNGLTIFKKVP